MAESFDAVLAEVRELAAPSRYPLIGNGNVRKLADRLQYAHEAEVAELRKQLQFWKDSSDDVHNLWQADKDRADRAVGLLRSISVSDGGGVSANDVEGVNWFDARDAFLSEQAGERENGDG